jgi:hypothetical protein
VVARPITKDNHSVGPQHARKPERRKRRQYRCRQTLARRQERVQEKSTEMCERQHGERLGVGLSFAGVHEWLSGQATSGRRFGIGEASVSLDIP